MTVTFEVLHDQECHALMFADVVQRATAFTPGTFPEAAPCKPLALEPVAAADSASFACFPSFRRWDLEVALCRLNIAVFNVILPAPCLGYLI